MAGAKGNGAKGNGYADRMMARARELRDSGAFEPARAQAGPASAAEAKGLAAADARGSRRLVVVFALVAFAAASFSLLLPYWDFDAMGRESTVYAPGDVLDCYALWFNLHVAPLFDHALYNRADAMLAAFSETHDAVTYSLVMNRAAVTAVAILCGIMLAVSGLLFQTAFRNPLAAPSSLGVSDGVTLGCIVFSLLGYSSIDQAPLLYLLLVYGLGAAAVAAVMLLSRTMAGGARYNVLDMLLLGTVICQLLSGINGFISNFLMDEMTWFNFYDVQQAGDALSEPAIRLVAVVMFVVTVVPAFVLRFKLNLIAFSDDDGRMMGSRASLLRIGSLVLGSAMQLVAIATFGQVAMMSLAVPFVVRYMLPADFRYQFLGNCLVGITVLLACVMLQHFAVFGAVTMPLGTIVSIFIVPFFVWMVAFGHGRW